MLVRRALDGDGSACSVILRQIAPKVESTVVGLCSGGAARQRARELVSDLVSDCFGATNRPRGRDVLLSYYDGRASLVSWLITVAMSRLRNWWKSGRHRYELAEGESATPFENRADPAGVDGASDGDAPEVCELLALALARGFEGAARREMVWLRLVFLHEIPQQTVARVWGVHPSGVSRGIGETLDQIRKNALTYLRRVDPYLEIEWEDCLALCERSVGGFEI